MIEQSALINDKNICRVVWKRHVSEWRRQDRLNERDLLYIIDRLKQCFEPIAQRHCQPLRLTHVIRRLPIRGDDGI